MPRANVGDVERWLQDHDTDVVDESPPILNTWYEVFHAFDVRLIWCAIYQSNDENAGKDLEIRWTIDGTVYFVAYALDDATESYVYRIAAPSTGGTDGLGVSGGITNAARYVDKRGLDFKVEIRITEALGTNQRLRCHCVRETQEIT